MFVAALAVNAQETVQYFDNKPFGWATCSSPSGTHYKLTGGYYKAVPKTVVLYANGTDDREAIINAIKTNDVIILDGSQGDFLISAFMDFKDLKNKSILGRNHARLCTKWYITPEYKQALVDAKLNQYSSGQGSGGELLNGQTVDEDREYYTRLTLIQATGDESESYRNAGIFKLRGETENIIIRNLVFQGPGSVDVGGADLMSNNGGNHVWIDHCEFIDGMDGNLDSGHNPADMYVTYSWNVFRYTDRSYSHPYSNGTGWDQGFLQYITYANCLWGAGCARRLPQADHVYIHLLNNYHNCPGNAVGIAINATSHALIEGNNAASGVKNPFVPGSFSDTYYVCRDNVGYGQYNNKSNTSESLDVPYEYLKMAGADVPTVLQGAYGAGATLDDPTPTVEQPQPTVNTESHAWSFESWSSETLEHLGKDTKQWKLSNNIYNNVFAGTDQEPLTADGVELSETKGLLFSIPKADAIGLYTNSDKSIRLINGSVEICVPGAKKGDQITVELCSANKTAARGVTVTNASPERCEGIERYSATFTVQNDDGVILKPTASHIHIYSITLQRPAEQLRGDVNGDGVVNVSDVTATISHILQLPTEGFDAKVADLNDDGVVNVSDVSLIINIILGK